jgi:glutathione S-transferase
MRLYNSVGPNPHVVRMFAAEKGIPLTLVDVDILKGANRSSEFLGVNPAGQTPALDLGDGRYLTEITAICEYLDEMGPGPSLIGSTPEERGECRMWVRRVDLNIVEPMANGFRYAEGLPMFQSRMRCIPQAAADLKALAQEKLTWLSGLMGEKPFICGDRLTLADILLFGFLTFGANVGQPLPTGNPVIMAWYERMKARPSAAA